MPTTTDEEYEVTAIALADLVKVRRRFLRSVNVVRDLPVADALHGYIRTPTVVSCLDRIATSIQQPSLRAFSITGTYGSGKSAFVLLATKLLAPPPMGDLGHRAQLRDQEPELASRLLPNRHNDGYWPVMLTGGREPLAKALVHGLIQSAYQLPEMVSRTVLRKLRRNWASVLDADQPTAQDVTRLYEAFVTLVQQYHSGSSGLLVVIDELGKFLEFSALHPEQGDIQVLQEMAECAARSVEHPLLLITVLHQAFEEYAQKLGSQQRNEWVKVQGRFVDIPFQDGAEETTRLLSEAIERRQEDFVDARVGLLTERHLDKCQDLGLVPKAISASEFRDLLQRAYPLHPLALLAIPYVFRRFGQNERSLFSFLSSEEPFGFQMFLRENVITTRDVPLLRLDHLYEYIVSALGSSLYSHATSKLWSEAEEALHRLWDHVPLHSQLVKTIALLHILGEETRMLPSRDLLRFALVSTHVTEQDVDDALNELQATTLITYRRFKGAFRLYEGSDIDIDAKLRDARSHFSQGVDAVGLATRLEVTPPIVARRHSYETGTLRFFEVRCCRPNTIEQEVLVGPSQADGLLLLCLASHNEELLEAQRVAQEFLVERSDVILGINMETDALHEAAVAVECLLWVQAETPELLKDRVANREVMERLTEASYAFQSEWDRLLRPRGAAMDGGSWYYSGNVVPLSDYRQLQALVSRACKDAYPFTPKLLNELINRKQISSTAAAARGNLIKALIEKHDKPRLGIEGYPPELSIYASVLGNTGIHRPVDAETWAIFPPDPKKDSALPYIWKEIERFLFDDLLIAKPLASLHAHLRAKPYGLADGLIPVLLCAILVYHRTAVAVYEDGRFVVDLDSATFERMIKQPRDFRLQGCLVSGERQLVLARFAAKLLKEHQEPTLVNVAAKLYRLFDKLDEYTQKTQNLTEQARQVRDAFKEGKEPEQLLFIDLPLLLGTRPFTSDNVDAENVSNFFEHWNKALEAITSAYPMLLARVEKSLCDGFGIRTWQELQIRSASILNYVTESRLKAFVLRASDEVMQRQNWLESVAAGIVGRPPSTWGDAEEERFTNSSPSLISAFQHSELLAHEKQRMKAGIGQVAFRIAVTQDSGLENARIVFVSETDKQQIEKLTRKMMRQFDEWMEDEPQEVRLAVVTRVAQEMLKGEQSE